MSVNTILQAVYADEQDRVNYFQEQSESKLATELAPFLRQRAIEHLATSPAPRAQGWREHYDNLKAAGVMSLSREDWLERQGKDKCWGTDVEAIALGELLDITVMITPVKNGVAQNCMEAVAGSDPKRPAIHLYNEDNRHWYFYGDNPRKTQGGGNCLYHSFAQAFAQMAATEVVDAKSQAEPTELGEEYRVFAAQLWVIEDQATKLNADARINPKHARAAALANQLVRELYQHGEDYFGMPVRVALARVLGAHSIPPGERLYRENNSRNTFVTRCLVSMNKVRSELETHRGWKQILGNLALALAGLLVGYALAVAVNKYTTGRYLFFRTDAAQKLDTLENTLRPVPSP